VKRLINPLDFADDPAELELQLELARLGIENDPQPESCPKCGGPLEATGGMVGETMLICSDPNCQHIAWCDHEGAIRRVL
jgi:ssDNA-binding Zn-finger/Zn-ribbon topoisomerase 1